MVMCAVVSSTVLLLVSKHLFKYLQTTVSCPSFTVIINYISLLCVTILCEHSYHGTKVHGGQIALVDVMNHEIQISC